MIHDLRKTQLSRAELDYEAAIEQLKRESLKLNLIVEVLLQGVHNDALDLCIEIIEKHEARWLTKGIKGILAKELKNELIATIQRQKEPIA